MRKKRFLTAIVPAILLFIGILSSGCGILMPVVPNPETGVGTTSAEQESPSEEGTTATASTGERGPMKDVSYLSDRELGLTAFTVSSDHESVADAIHSQYMPEVIVRAYADGIATLTVADYWGHTAVAEIAVEGGKIRSLTVSRAFSDPKVVNVRLAGAVGDGAADDTEAIQNAINSLPEGGEVLFPAGVYSIRRLILGQGISLRLQGKAENPTAGYTADLAARVAGGKEFAVLKSRLQANNLILNHEPGTNDNRLSGALGKSDISIAGGVIDLNGSIASGAQIDVNLDGPQARPACSNTCAIAFSYGENYLFDHVIFKDGYAGHAMQLCGVRNAEVRDCMFAGCTIRPNVKGSTEDLLITRETIQIEYAHTGAIPPSTFEPGEFYYCANIAVRGCYFGKSDLAGDQMICIGQHGQNGTANCTGLIIENNVFDNPYISALSLINYVDVEIRGNEFRSDRSGYATGCLIVLQTKTSNSTYSGKLLSGQSATIVNAMGFEHDGLQNVSIRENRFLITGTSNKRLLGAESTSYVPGARTVRITRRAEGSFFGETYEGFLKCTNYIGGLTFSDNDVTVTAANYHTDYLASISDLVNPRFLNNRFRYGSGISFSRSWNGYEGFSCTREISSANANGLTFETDLTGYEIRVPNGKGDFLRFRSDGSARTLKLVSSTPHIKFACEIDSQHNAIVTVSVDEGFTFCGWTCNGVAYEASGAISLNGTLTLTTVCR